MLLRSLSKLEADFFGQCCLKRISSAYTKDEKHSSIWKVKCNSIFFPLVNLTAFILQMMIEIDPFEQDILLSNSVPATIGSIV